MRVLVLNAGSSSLKFQFIEVDESTIANNTERKLARGNIERIGGDAVLTLVFEGGTKKGAAHLRDYPAAVEHILNWLGEVFHQGDRSNVVIDAVGHRVVHGGERFVQSTALDDTVVAQIEDLIELAPLHNPHNIAGIRAAWSVLGRDIPAVAVFDTAFHSTIPAAAHIYALPYQYYRRDRVRRYGFHGTSHRYVAHRYRQLTGRTREATRIVTLHLGNGASACAISRGRSVETSMGFTPLEGLVMGTRSGDIDPAVCHFIASKEGLSPAETDTLLNKQSGLLGISGLTSDMRDLLAEERELSTRATLAIDVFCHRVRKYVGAYLAVLNGADAIVFTGGIGENSPEIRARICTDLDSLGIKLDEASNTAITTGHEGRFDRSDSRIALWVIPTDEEMLIARDTFRVVSGRSDLS